MKMFKKILIIISIALVGFFTYCQTWQEEDSKIISGLKLARVAISAHKVQNVVDLINDGSTTKTILESDSYSSLVNTLNSISEHFTVKSRWSYIATDGSDDSINLIVLTIAPEDEQPHTLPDYDFDVKKYPIFKDIINGSKEFGVSSIAWDDEYNILTRTGIIKILNADNEMIGILCVDLHSDQIIITSINSLLLLIIYTCFVLLAIYKFVN